MKRNKIYDFLLTASFIFYAIFVVWNILFKYVSPSELFSEGRYFSRSLNLIPFNDLFEGNYIKLDVWGNMLLFIPFGIYLKIWTQKSWKQLISVAALTSLSFEVLQYAFAIGASDITDIIYNTVGALAGILIYNILKRICRSEKRVKSVLSVTAGIVMLLVIVIIALLFISNA